MRIKSIKAILLLALFLASSSLGISFVLRTMPAPSLKVNEVAENPQFWIGSPIYSDVLFTSRWISQGGILSPERLAAMAAFGATKSVWTYLNGTPAANAQFIGDAKEIVSTFQGSVVSRVKMADYLDAWSLDLNGDPVVYPWLRAYAGWAEADVTRPAYKAMWLAHAKADLDAGTDSIQQDDVRMNAATFQYGGSFSDEAMAAFNVYLSNTLTSVELVDLGIPDISIYDYAQHLRDISAPVGDDFGSWAPGGSEEELKQHFYEFCAYIVHAFYAEVFAELEIYVGRHVPRSANNGDATETWYYDQFDYMIGELHTSEEDPLAVYTQMKASRDQNKLQAFVFIPTYDIPLDRRIMASIYGAGALPVAPWDVWMGSSSSRYYGDPDDYADIYAFVKTNAAYFNGYEDAAVTGRMGPFIKKVTYDSTNSRTIIEHYWRADYQNIPGGSEVVINGVIYTTSGLTGVGFIYLAGNMTSTIHVMDVLTRIADSDLEAVYMTAMNGQTGSPLGQVVFNPNFYGQGPTTIVEYPAHTNFMSISSGAGVVIDGQSYTTSRSSGTGTIYLAGDLTDAISVNDRVSSISNSAASFVVYDQWTSDDRYADGEAPVVVSNIGVMAWTRAKPDDVTAPVVIHLVDYMDSGAFDIALRPRRFFDTNLKVTLLRPNAAPAISYHASLDGTSTVHIPDLDPLGTGMDSWGVLVVEPL